MRDGEWRLIYPGTDYSFGTSELPAWNITTPVVGDPDLRLADGDKPRADGRSFGADFRSGLNIAFDLGVRGPTEAAARAEAQRLAIAWRADAVRKVPGATADLYMCYAGRERMVVGRPRRFAPDFSQASLNRLVTVTADFDAVDDLFYDADVQLASINLAAPVGGGLTAPLRAPLTTTASSNRASTFTVGGEVPTWPVIEIVGPITNPVVDIVGLSRFEMNTSLAYDQRVTIDTRPWVQTVLRNDGESLAGTFTRNSPRISEANLPPGTYGLGFAGIDPTGTSSVRVYWHDAYTTL